MKSFITLVFLLFSSSSIFFAQTDPDPTDPTKSIHVCEASWFFWFEYGMNQCGYTTAQARAFANSKRRECYLTINQ